MYQDPKRIRNKRLAIYLDTYVHERLSRLVEMTGGELSASGRDALELGLEWLEREIHAKQCANTDGQKRGLSQGQLCA